MAKIRQEDNPSALKHFFNRDLLKRISASLEKLHPEFDSKEFLNLMSEMKNLEMKPRVLLIRDELKKQLPSDYKKALKIILKSSRDKNLGGFDLWPYTEFIRAYGIEDVDASLRAMKDLTKKFTCEWAVRPFIQKYPGQSMKFLSRCALDSSVDVRRWASEGARPRLPWGERLQDFIQDPSPTLNILEKLKFDPEIYVRKSVANHLNDIAKDHPEIVIKTLAKWRKQADVKDLEKIQWIIRHALRSLIKAGNPGALSLVGVSGKAEIRFLNFSIDKKTVKMGQIFEFKFDIHSMSKKSQRLVVDYVIHFMKADKATAPKVFKMKTFDLLAHQKLSLSKKHRIVPITTRRYYGGQHAIEIQVNGSIVGRQNWWLDLK